eukprot:CAMPEP_0185418712 /NCGR_PEP_ID=MMETSP1365-20130426/8989_1 /TAXON_ID=38817 /ORGANISM="Gephyrocapsa oceanica, Strain RCC1303" /LENGTH=323 /DNA_ID=CAMNT_0028022195 /DNA_START=160 /DNA_END=1126 /DNA_ORIENTATION=+
MGVLLASPSHAGQPPRLSSAHASQAAARLVHALDLAREARHPAVVEAGVLVGQDCAGRQSAAVGRDVEERAVFDGRDDDAVLARHLSDHLAHARVEPLHLEQPLLPAGTEARPRVPQDETLAAESLGARQQPPHRRRFLARHRRDHLHARRREAGKRAPRRIEPLQQPAGGRGRVEDLEGDALPVAPHESAALVPPPPPRPQLAVEPQAAPKQRVSHLRVAALPRPHAALGAEPALSADVRLPHGADAVVLFHRDVPLQVDIPPLWLPVSLPRVLGRLGKDVSAAALLRARVLPRALLRVGHAARDGARGCGLERCGRDDDAR